VPIRTAIALSADRFLLLPVYTFLQSGNRSWEAGSKMHEAEMSLRESRTREREFSRESNRTTEPVARSITFN